MRLGRLEIGLLNPKVTIENFVLYNAAEFGGAPMVDLPELHVEYDRPALREAGCISSSSASTWPR